MDKVLDKLGDGLANAFLMGWEVWWALVLGFAISAIVQAWVPRERVERALAGGGARPVATATALGAASSSCSYAAVAIAKSLFQKGASAASALAFQFASTNLVWELGLVLWILIGWQFTLAEFVGGMGWRERVTSTSAWSDVAHNFRGDWQMLWKEITIGFLLAGFIALLGDDFFNALFVEDAPSAIRTVENVVAG